MNIVIFSGRLAETPDLETHGETKVVRFRLLRNEFAGKNEDGSRKERVVAVQFTAFGRQAEAVARHSLVGDQLFVKASLRNNQYTDNKGVERFGFNFDVEEVEFAAPGPEKRKQLADHTSQA